MNIITLPEVDSTNTYLRSTLPDAPHGTVVSAVSQTAGRGQRGNSWEASPGLNLTFSILLRPLGVSALQQYAISEAVAVAMVETLRAILPMPERVAIKWPNDIYYEDKKISGILIENSLIGTTIERSVVGIGLNVNQEEFHSDAPNPVSMARIAGRQFNLDPLLHEIVTRILARVDLISDDRGKEEVSRLYHDMLWRRHGYHPYRLPDGTRFQAAIQGVAPTGHLTLLHTDGTLSTHAFKEVFSIL